MAGGYFRLWVKDETSGTVVKRCDFGPVCEADASFVNGDGHTYKAYVAAADPWGWNTPYDVQAGSKTVLAERAPWTVSLGAASVDPVTPAGFTVTSITPAAGQWVTCGVVLPRRVCRPSDWEPEFSWIVSELHGFGAAKNGAVLHALDKRYD